MSLRVAVLPLELGSSGLPVVFFQRFNMEFEVSDDVTAHYPALLALKKQNIATASCGCLLAAAVRARQSHSEYEKSWSQTCPSDTDGDQNLQDGFRRPLRRRIPYF